MRSPLPMRRIADLVGSPLAWAAAVALLFSVAADADPAALRALQGPQRDLRRVLVSGSPPGAEGLFAPEGSLLLVDAALRIRGVYRRDDLDDLLRDAMLVVNAN